MQSVVRILQGLLRAPGSAAPRHPPAGSGYAPKYPDVFHRTFLDDGQGCKLLDNIRSISCSKHWQDECSIFLLRRRTSWRLNNDEALLTYYVCSGRFDEFQFGRRLPRIAHGSYSIRRRHPRQIKPFPYPHTEYIPYADCERRGLRSLLPLQPLSFLT